MQAIVIARQGAPVAANVQVIDDWPEPVPAPGDVLVRTEAAALNHLDLWVGRGMPGLDLEFPRVTGSDGCGVVEAVGDGVDEAWIGRRVVLNAAVAAPALPSPDVDPAPPDLVMIGEYVHGTLAAKFLAPATNVLDVGQSDPGQAAAYALTHLTAWRMLLTRARLTAGQTVLITGIGGGVALACLGIARHLGCHTIVTSRHASKLDRAKKLGADDVVIDDGGDWSRTVRALTGGRGVDICADSVGKALHVAAIKSLARGGVYVTCGCTSGADAVTDLARVFWNQLTIAGSTMGDMHEFRQAMRLFTRGRLRPVIDSTFEASDAAMAYERLESADQFGKIVVRF